MPIIPTYPGVYIQEIPSGVRTITGVSTSITAFIGRAKRGPVNEPITINSYSDFERIFGGLWLKSTLGYAVRDFYLNGGSQAIIVRLVHHEPENNEENETTSNPGESASSPKQASKAKVSLDLKQFKLELEAANEGDWGNFLTVRIDDDVPDKDNLLFNLTIQDEITGENEVFRNVTMDPNHPRSVDLVLLNQSDLMRVVKSQEVTEPEGTETSTPTTEEEITETSTPTTEDAKAEAKAKDGDDGDALTSHDFIGKEAQKEGLYALEKADLFNLLCIPPYTNDNKDIDYESLVDPAAAYCEKRRAFFIIDPPNEWKNKDDAKKGVTDNNDGIGSPTSYAAVFFPRIREPNPLRNNAMEDFAPCGAIAGVFARTDVERGVWKAPAGIQATLKGVSQLSVPLTDAENGELNTLGINCLRTLPAAGRVVWGARTREGDDRLASEWKYTSVRRLALFLEESLYRGTQWAVFEPNDEPLWAQIRLNLGAFMHSLFRQGAFQGQKPEEAYFVKCDKETTTQNDINQGIVNIVVGFAPLKPAEFVIISIQGTGSVKWDNIKLDCI